MLWRRQEDLQVEAELRGSCLGDDDVAGLKKAGETPLMIRKASVCGLFSFIFCKGISHGESRKVVFEVCVQARDNLA